MSSIKLGNNRNGALLIVLLGGVDNVMLGNMIIKELKTARDSEIVLSHFTETDKAQRRRVTCPSKLLTPPTTTDIHMSR